LGLNAREEEFFFKNPILLLSFFTSLSLKPTKTQTSNILLTTIAGKGLVSFADSGSTFDLDGEIALANALSPWVICHWTLFEQSMMSP
jgi:hypothetical protein